MTTTPDIALPFQVAAWTGDARRGYLRLLDQTRLPQEEVYIECRDAMAVWDAIRRLSVRGAPAIGIAAGYGMVLAAQFIPDSDFMTGLEAAGEYLKSSRPTAVNLEWAVGRVLTRAGRTLSSDTNLIRDALLEEAVAIAAEDARLCLAIGRHAEPLIRGNTGVLTHCNAGALATGGIGTATAGMYLAHAAGHKFTAYCDETRPLLQGARLTSWELSRAGLSAVVIADNMAAQLMSTGRVGMVIVGADRIAANGDAANKIGTYGVAILARHHNIPFYVAAPYSTFDLAIPNGEKIPIEHRAAEEITNGFGRRTAPEGIATYNPAFDVTPASLITAIVTDRGLVQPVTPENVRQVVGG